MRGSFEVSNAADGIQNHKELDLEDRVEGEDGADQDEHKEAEEEHREVVYSVLASEVDTNKNLSYCFPFHIESETFGGENIH
jgi:hypothetical protein